MSDKPTACLEHKPTRQTVHFAGKPINLSEISRSQRIDLGYLSRVFSGKQQPSISTALRICSALGMEIGPFLQALQNS